MKVGILTIFAVPNYGAMLQSYGLASHLRSWGLAAEVINYRQPALENYFRFKLKFPPAVQHWLRLRAGHQFVETRIPKSADLFRAPEAFAAQADRYDALITGSDQVWFTGPVQYYDPLFFLDLPQTRARKISYAASAGGNKSFGEFESRVRTALARFDHIGVRDAHTASLVQPLTDKVLTQTVDPVFLHDFAELVKENSPSREPYILVFGDFRGSLARVVEQARATTGIAKVVTVQYPCPGATTRDATAGPIAWLNWFRHAAFVVTSYFHGTVVAVKFRRPFVSVPTAGRREKVATLLEPLGLRHRCFIDEAELERLPAVAAGSIDWNAAHARLDTRIADSRAFLRHALA